MANFIIAYRNTLLFTYVYEVLHEYQNTNVRILYVAQLKIVYTYKEKKL